MTNEHEHSFTMTLNLNVLNHLGLNLYSNVPAVLSEVVANSWDADAENVDIRIYTSGRKITITDDGHGMNQVDINNKFLTVGYRRREAGESVSPLHKRPVMGRKGIGKLSLFSIASCIEVYTVKDGQQHAFRMRLDKIKKAIESGSNGRYHPDAISDFPDDLIKGTRIVLTDFKKKLHHTPRSLRRRLARRFSIMGPENKFNVTIDGEPISISDRDYFHKIQNVWYYGDVSKRYADLCVNAENRDERPNTVTVAPDEAEPADPEGTAPQSFELSGWIGTVRVSGDLKDAESSDNLNKIIVMFRGRLAQEDILEEFNEGGVYAAYLMGEIHADFLDTNDADDIATSSRQRVIEDDPRYIALKEFIQRELKHIQNQWTDLRQHEGTKRALDVPPIKEWFQTLGPDNKNRAKSLFGKVGRLTIDSEEDRRTLLKHSILAFEHLRAKENLDALKNIKPENIVAFTEIFQDQDDIEATLYHQIVKGRIEVIRALQEKVDANVREKVLQEHLYDHLWLLDPGWERADASDYMEQRVATEFGEIDAKLSEDEAAGRVDIKYRTTSGKHLIIELKRAERIVSSYELMEQCDKYRRALRKLLDQSSRTHEPIELVCVVGRDLSDWSTPDERETSRNALKELYIRVVLYQELVENATRAYQAYLDQRKHVGRIFELIQGIESGSVFSDGQ